MKKTIQITKNILYYVTVLFLSFVIIFSLIKPGELINVLQVGWYKVVSPSMEPNIMINDYIIVKRHKDSHTLENGDIIIFETHFYHQGGYSRDVVTHYFSHITEEGHIITYPHSQFGKEPDEIIYDSWYVSPGTPYYVTADDLVGKHVETIPFHSAQETLIFLVTRPIGIIITIILGSVIFYFAYQVTISIDKKKEKKMSWKTFLETEANKPYYKSLMSFIEQEELTKTIYPKKEDRLNAFKYANLEDIKVVIIGQDPYHGPNQAHGLSFSTLDSKIPKSLQNIYKELKDDLDIEVPKTGDLTNWAKQGVLLLNTLLTVESGKPLSHKNQGWEIFTSEVIQLLNNLDQPIVFILWGSHAKSYKKDLNNPRHLILESNHPSPLSAYRGFFGCKVFSKTNEFLKNNQVNVIDWEIK